MSNTPLKNIFWHSEDINYTYPDKVKTENIVASIFKDHNKDFETINIIFCSDDALLEINRRYLHHDYYTDIITFPIDENPISGDLFISIDRVKENALHLSAVFLYELQRVVIHGVLHLVGYKDESPEEKAEMRQKENYYLEKPFS